MRRKTFTSQNKRSFSKGASKMIGHHRTINFGRNLLWLEKSHKDEGTSAGLWVIRRPAGGQEGQEAAPAWGAARAERGRNCSE